MSVTGAVAVRARHSPVPSGSLCPDFTVSVYEEGHTGVTSPATFGPFSTMVGSDTLKSDTRSGTEWSMHVALTAAAVMSAGRAAVERAGSLLDDPVF